MFGKKCSLCGGKLDGRGICTECGLDNTKNDKAYHTGQNRCENQPLTHVHTENTMEAGEAKRKTIRKTSGEAGYTGKAEHTNPTISGRRTSQSYTSMRNPKKKRGCSLFLFVFILIIIGIFVFSSILDNIDLVDRIQYEWEGLFEEDYSEEYNSEWEERDPYADVTREISAEGSEESYILTSGCYIVGVHIPEGIYQADMEDDFDVIQVDDPEQNIYLYEYRYLEEENNCHLDDLRLYEGAVLYVETKTQAVLSTSNAQPLKEQAIGNPLTQEYNLKGTVRAGEDFEPGVYDLELVSGEGYITFYLLMDEEYDYAIENTLSLGEAFDTGSCYKNLVIPEGAELRCDSGVELRLTPSDIISSTDYRSFYETY